MNIKSLLRSPYVVGLACLASIIALILSTSLVLLRALANEDREGGGGNTFCAPVTNTVTDVTDINGICSNGAWGDWSTNSQVDDGIKCAVVTTRQRTYTGTRVKQLLGTYITTSSCGGGRGGGGTITNSPKTVRSVSTACQVTETEVVYNQFSKEKSVAFPGCADKGPDTIDKPRTPQTDVTTTAVDITGSDISTDITGQENNLFDASKVQATLTAKPLLVRPGTTSVLTWASEATRSCTVKGSNGDSWNGISGQQISSPITGEVKYVMRCAVLNGSQLERQVTVSIIPNWREK